MLGVGLGEERGEERVARQSHALLALHFLPSPLCRCCRSLRWELGPLHPLAPMACMLLSTGRSMGCCSSAEQEEKKEHRTSRAERTNSSLERGEDLFVLVRVSQGR